MTIAIYPGTFDPITLGHIDLVQRSAKLFETVLVAVSENGQKSPVFDFATRIDLSKRSLIHIDNAKVCGFDGLLSDFAKKKKAGIILRGLRAVSDFEYEFQLASMNRRLNPELESLFLTPSEQFSYISSSLVREIATFGGNAAQFVSQPVAQALAEKFGHQSSKQGAY